MTCEHNKTCGDCFSPQHVAALEDRARRLDALLVELLARLTRDEEEAREDSFLSVSDRKVRADGRRTYINRLRVLLTKAHEHAAAGRPDLAAELLRADVEQGSQR